MDGYFFLEQEIKNEKSKEVCGRGEKLATAVPDDKLNSLQEQVDIDDIASVEEVTEEIASDNSVSIIERKRKQSDESDLGCSSTEVSVSPKRARLTSSCDTRQDHPYCTGSPCKLRRQVDDLTDKVKSMQKKLITN